MLHSGHYPTGSLWCQLDYSRWFLHIPCLCSLGQSEYSTSDQAQWDGLKPSFLVTILSTLTRYPPKVGCPFHGEDQRAEKVTITEGQGRDDCMKLEKYLSDPYQNDPPSFKKKIILSGEVHQKAFLFLYVQILRTIQKKISGRL